MRFIPSSEDELKLSVDVLGVGAFTSGIDERASKIDVMLNGMLSRCYGRGFEGKEGDLYQMHTHGKIGADVIAILGLGEREKLGMEAARKASAALVRAARKVKANRVACLPFSMNPFEWAQSVVEGAMLGSYRFERYRGEKDHEIREFILLDDSSEVRNGIERGQIIGDAVTYARDLGNEPANVMTPERLSQEARRLAEEHGLSCEIFDVDEAERMGMGAFVGVARGSSQPAKFIHLSYRGGGRKIALIGKGLTFDSGGLDLKPADRMEHMKYDMCGAAVCLAVLKAACRLKLKIDLDVYIPATENMPGGSALKPGDILKTYSGKTVEVVSTDAEGRLILADAISYAASKGVDEMIDVATLTGACAIALGRLASGIMGDDEIVSKMIDCAEKCGEKIWRLPLYEEYREQLKSEVADIKNLGEKEGGAITGALFLKEFVGKTKWAHLDIAGTAWTDKELPYCPKGATGSTVRTLIEYLSRIA